MRKGFQKAACVSLAVLMAVMFPACKKKDKGFEPDFAVKPYDVTQPHRIYFEIPKEWGEVADPSGAGMLVFAGREAYEDGGFNNVSVCIYPSGNQAPDLKDVEAAFQEQFEVKVKEQYAEASGFAYDSFETPRFPVFTAQYTVPAMGKELVQKIYYPLLDNYQVYVAACDNGGEGISGDEAAKGIIYTLQVGNKQEEASSEE